MNDKRSGRTAVMLAWLWGAAFAVGCGEKAAPLPPPKAAADVRPILEAALEAWKNGKTPESLGEQTPPIQVTDKAWKAGQKIESYEIVRNQPTGDRGQLFTVKLRSKQTQKEQEVRYVVSGTDPVCVIRDTDMADALSPGNEASKPKPTAPAAPARPRPR